MTKLIKCTLPLPEEDFYRLKVLAARLKMSVTDVIRRGIRNTEFFQKAWAEKSKVLVKDKNGDTYIITEDK